MIGMVHSMHGKDTICLQILVRTPEVKRSLGKHMCNCGREDSITMDIKKNCVLRREPVQMVQDTVQ